MSVNCPYCKNNTHSEGFQNEECQRVFLTKEQALSVLDKKYHNFIQAPPSMLIGCNYSSKEMRSSLKNASQIEICDPLGAARKMSHGVSLLIGDRRHFFETIEEKLVELEKKLEDEK